MVSKMKIKKTFLLTIVICLSVGLLALSVLQVADAAYIFTDGFESGNFNAWNTSLGALTINNQTVHTGSYSAENSLVGGASNDLYYQALSSVTNPIYMREYVYINSTTVPSTNGDYYAVGGLSSSAGGQFGDGELTVFNIGGTLYWGLYFRDANSTTGFTFSISESNSTATAIPITIGWHSIELGQITGPSNGVYGEEQLWVDGAKIVDVAANNYQRTPANVVIGGTQSVFNVNNRWNYYIDDVVVSSSYIGPPSAQLTTQTNYGTVSPPNDTYDSGSSLTITATPPTSIAGERYVWQGWTGTGVGSYTGMGSLSGDGVSYTASITMNDNITETASWDHQYNLTVTSAYDSPSPSSGWFDSGSMITDSVASPVSGGSGTQYLCTGWSGIGSVPASGGVSAVTFTISEPSNITWNWQTQYYLTVSSTYGTTSGSGWYNSGSSAFAAVISTTVPTSGGEAAFSGWTGDASGTGATSNSILMDGPETAIAQWIVTTTGSSSPTPTHTPTPSPTPAHSTQPTSSPTSPSPTPKVPEFSSAALILVVTAMVVVTLFVIASTTRTRKQREINT